MKKLTVTLSDETARELDEAAKAAGLTLANAVEFCLGVGCQRMRKKAKRIDFGELIRSLSQRP